VIDTKYSNGYQPTPDYTQRNRFAIEKTPSRLPSHCSHKRTHDQDHIHHGLQNNSLPEVMIKYLDHLRPPQYQSAKKQLAKNTNKI